MTDRELVSEIKQRFKIPVKETKAGLLEHELDLIYKVFTKKRVHFE